MTYPLQQRLVLGILVFIPLIALSDTGSYAANVRLQSTIETTSVSGFKGTTQVLKTDGANQALYAISSSERRDVPCNIEVSTEDLNQRDARSTAKRSWCGKPATSRPLLAGYSDNGLNETRVFISGLRVCMNRADKRIKGFQLAGKHIDDNGRVSPIEFKPYSYVRGGGGSRIPPVISTPENPATARPNCDAGNWKRWATCSRPDQVATGLVVHVGAGNLPRAITGIALRCQIVSFSRL